MPSSKRIIISLSACFAAWVGQPVAAQSEPAAQAKTVAELVRADSARALAAGKASPAGAAAAQAAASQPVRPIRRAMRAGPRDPRVEVKETWGVLPSVKALADVDGVPMVLLAGQRVGAVQVLNVGGGCVTLTRAVAVNQPAEGKKGSIGHKSQSSTATATRMVCYTPASPTPVVTAAPGAVTVPTPLAGLPPGTPITAGGPLPR